MLVVNSEVQNKLAYGDGEEIGFSSVVLNESPLHGEKSIAEERDNIEVTPDSLKHDNKSDEAKFLNDKWLKTRDKRELILVDKCGDPRSFEDSPETKVVLPSIAASGPIDPFVKAYHDPRVQGIVEMSHYSSLIARPGENPGGCVGRVVKGAQQKGRLSAEEGDTQQFVKEFVPHEDVVINSLLRAAKIASFTDKPVLAAVQDHITGRVKPLAYFELKSGGGLVGETIIPYHLLFDGNYDPKRIYENGVPELPLESLPDIFVELIEDNRQHIQELTTTYHDFMASQEVANPKTLLLSTSTKPARARYPHTFGLPNTFVNLVFGRERIEGEDTFSPQILHKLLRQAHAFITKSYANHNDDGAEFSRLNRVLIETSNLELSLKLATELGEKPWMQQWMDLSNNHRIMLAETRGGLTQAIQYLT